MTPERWQKVDELFHDALQCEPDQRGAFLATYAPAMDILVVQEWIAREISDGLRLRLSGEEKKLLAKHHTENADA